MEFGWNNLFGAAIVVIMLIPNLIFARKHTGQKNLCTNRAMNLMEQIGRYGCFILMWLPLVVGEFGFAGIPAFLIYVIGNGILLFVYLILWAFYFKNSSVKTAMALAVVPVCIFLLSGLLLRHWLLSASAVLFGVGHIYVTKVNQK